MGRDPAELLEETFGDMDPPLGTEWVWDFFLMLNSARQHSGSGPLPIPFSEMSAWSRLTQITLEVWEVQALRNLDNVWLNWRADHG